MAELKTSVKDVPLANDRLYTEIANLSKVNKGIVIDIMDFIGTYTADVIKRGTMESVMIPYFGKFKPKLNKLKAAVKVNKNKRNGKDILYRATNGMKLKDLRAPEDQINMNNETI